VTVGDRVYANSKLGYAIEKKLLDVPSDTRIAGSTKIIPHVFVGDDAFGQTFQTMTSKHLLS